MKVQSNTAGRDLRRVLPRSAFHFNVDMKSHVLMFSSTTWIKRQINLDKICVYSDTFAYIC